MVGSLAAAIKLLVLYAKYMTGKMVRAHTCDGSSKKEMYLVVF